MLQPSMLVFFYTQIKLITGLLQDYLTRMPVRYNINLYMQT